MRYSFDLGAEADMLEAAVNDVLDQGIRTADLAQADGASPVSTAEMGDAVIAAMAARAS